MTFAANFNHIYASCLMKKREKKKQQKMKQV
jgi:hypothetical protein